VVLKIIPPVRRRDFSLSSLQFDLFFNIKKIACVLALTCRNGYGQFRHTNGIRQLTLSVVITMNAVVIGQYKADNPSVLSTDTIFVDIIRRRHNESLIGD